MEKARLSEYSSVELVKLFDSEAREIADGFIREKEDKKNSYYGVTHSQMRRFYNEVKSLDRKFGESPGAWDKNCLYIPLLKSKVSYNVARAIDKKPAEKDVYKNLSGFIMKYIGMVKDDKDFHIFTLLFEAVYGYYYKETVEKNIKGEH
jgi:CRISPR type III-A-associated protein Csm2